MTGEKQAVPSKLVAGYVLAGGGSTRFGRDKALAEMDGKTMLARMQTLLREVAGDVHVIAPADRYAAQGVNSIADLWPGAGPLGGILTALRYTEANDPQREWNLIVSCDMPFLTHAWLQFLIKHSARSDAQVVLAESQVSLEPLCACYRTNGRSALEKAFESGVRKVTAALKAIRMEVLDEKVWKRFDGTGRLFWNMNTATEYDEALRMKERNI